MKYCRTGKNRVFTNALSCSSPEQFAGNLKQKELTDPHEQCKSFYFADIALLILCNGNNILIYNYFLQVNAVKEQEFYNDFFHK
jgi:hypothetical protein